MAAIWRAQWAAAGRPDSTLVVVATYENPGAHPRVQPPPQHV